MRYHQATPTYRIAHHCVGLAGARLSVRKHTRVEAGHSIAQYFLPQVRKHLQHDNMST